MSMPHQFTDDPNSFQGPPANSSNTTVILVAIAVVCGTLMLICGGVIFGVVTSVREAQRNVEFTINENQWRAADQSAYQEYTRFVDEGRYSEALDSVNSGLDSSPESSLLHNNKAWLLATCPDDTVRDGELAVEHATKACELTSWRNAYYVDTLAAAYAEAGDFESAVKWQEDAIRLGGGTYSEDFRKRLRLFQAGKAYREGVPPYKETVDEQPVEFPRGLQPAKPDPNDVPAEESSEEEIADKELT